MSVTTEMNFVKSTNSRILNAVSNYAETDAQATSTLSESVNSLSETVESLQTTISTLTTTTIPALEARIAALEDSGELTDES